MTTSAVAKREVSRPEFIALIASLMALNALAIDVMLPALPNMAEALNVASENEAQLVLGTYMLGFGAAQLLFGPLSDRFGRRPPLLVGMLIYIAAAALAVVAPNFATLLALRFVQGLGAASTRVIAVSTVRDRFGGRAMAEVMSLVFMVFMIVPVVAPSVGQLLLTAGHWQWIFLFMAGLAVIVFVWVFVRLPETLMPENRRELRLGIVVEGFRIVFSNIPAMSYGLAGAFIFGALFGFISTSQQIYVGIYETGAMFPIYFAAGAGIMSVSSYTNSIMVRKIGMRRLAHGALLCFITFSLLWLVLAITIDVPLWLFFTLVSAAMFMFGWTAPNMNALAMEPLGNVAGTASSVFGFIQTAGGALLGTYIGQNFDGTLVPVATGYFVLGLSTLVLVLIAEKGRLFGVGEAYKTTT
ncbi:multidrug effflux MFS transporter [Pelagibacterium halotolerans]|uniref:multidrug effflux MFS transporter n=1 Tax=Pelagibacterium halotolerans TaxID=531813 RepID=UPI00384C01F6